MLGIFREIDILGILGGPESRFFVLKQFFFGKKCVIFYQRAKFYFSLSFLHTSRLMKTQKNVNFNFLSLMNCLLEHIITSNPRNELYVQVFTKIYILVTSHGGPTYRGQRGQTYPVVTGVWCPQATFPQVGQSITRREVTKMPILIKPMQRIHFWYQKHVRKRNNSIVFT